METPSGLEQVKAMYLIDRRKAGHVWYLWGIKNGEWEAIKTGDWQTIINKLKEVESDGVQKL